jgi:hypothetical protein
MARLEQAGRTMNPSGAGRVGAALRRSRRRGLMTYAAYLPAQADSDGRGTLVEAQPVGAALAVATLPR